MRSLDHKIESAIVNHRMLNSGDTVVLAVSGGPDSVCLLHLMAALAPRWGWHIHVAHMHHGIRGLDADEDARYVADLAAAMGYAFHLHHCDVPNIARKRGLGLEEAGRHVRYRFFAELADQIGAQAVAVGHHAGDQAETVLMNLLRGAGGTGLAGITPVRLIGERLKLIRPLLAVTRQEIEEYLRATGLQPRHDHTNDELDQTRNRIRHQLIPYLQQYNPRIKETLARTAEIIRCDELYLAQQVDEYLAKHLIRRYGLLSLSVAELMDQPLALRRRIIRRMVDLVSWEAKQSIAFGTSGTEARNVSVGPDLSFSSHVGFAVIEDLLEMMQPNASLGQAPKRSWSTPLPGGSVVRLSQGELFFLSPADSLPACWERVWRGTGSMELPEIGCGLLMRMANRPAEGWDRHSHLDQSVAEMELTVRSWRSGDRISLGETVGSKKLSDLFIDLKVPAPYRLRVPIIERAGEIIAVTGLMVAPAYRPPQDAVTAVELKLLTPDSERKDCGHAK